RGTPIILVAFLVGFGLPGLQLSVISTQSNYVYGVIALTLVYTAYVTEVYRAGIESVHPSQRMAARSLGLSYFQALRYVLVPPAGETMFPPRAPFFGFSCLGEPPGSPTPPPRS